MKHYQFLSIFCILFALLNQNVLIAQSKIERLKWINFSPYTQGQDPDYHSKIPEEQIIALLDSVKPWVEGIRTFGTLDGLEKIPKLAKERGLKVIVGIWLDRNTNTNAQQVASGINIANAGYADKIIVGSEVLRRNELTAGQIIGYINEVKQACPNIPVSFADIPSELTEHREVIDACDFMSVNIYPFWEYIPVDCAIRSFHQSYLSMKALANGKEIFISESGWKTEGAILGFAVPSLENAIRYDRELLNWGIAYGIEVNLFSAFDEPWKKKNNDYGWGIFDNEGILKLGMDTLFTKIETIDSTWLNVYIGHDSNDTINIDFMPPIGSFENIKGHINFLNPFNYKIATYIKVAGSWWIKPTSLNPTVPIQCNGQWEVDYTTGGSGQTTSDIYVCLIPVNYTPPDCNPCSSIPSGILNNALSMKHITRCSLPYDSIFVTRNIVCPGDTTTLITDEGISYLWDTGDTTKSIQVAPTTNTKYSVMVTKLSGCIETREVNVDVYPSEIDKITMLICDGDSLQIGDFILKKAGNYAIPLTNQYGCDSLVKLKLNIEPINQSDLKLSICEGEKYMMGDSIFSKTGDYTIIFENSGNCKSILNVDLIVNPVSHTNFTDTICQGDSILVGKYSFNFSVKQNVFLTSQYGCDSIVNLNLTVLQTNPVNVSKTICQGENLQIGDSVFSETGQYSVTLENQLGCDSVVNLDLTVNPASLTNLTETICTGENVLIGDTVFTKTGHYTVKLKNQLGCDSIVYLNLSVIQTNQIDKSQSICQGDSAIIGDSIFTKEGQHTVILNNQFGCDSIVTLNLTVNPTNNIDLTKTICLGDSVKIGDSIFTKEGQYTIILKNQFGCDSVVNFVLTVHPINQIHLIDTIENGDSIIIGDSVFTKTGNYTVILKNQLGCDSIVNLGLIVGVITLKEKEGLIKIYPNPTKDILNLEIENQIEDFEISILSETGQVLSSKQIKRNGTKKIEQLDLSGYVSGTYLIKIVSDKNIEVEKILLKK
jgi:exo-beta-1,3-glucanase (GH17 family)